MAGSLRQRSASLTRGTGCAAGHGRVEGRLEVNRGDGRFESVVVLGSANEGPPNWGGDGFGAAAEKKMSTLGKLGGAMAAFPDSCGEDGAAGVMD